MEARHEEPSFEIAPCGITYVSRAAAYGCGGQIARHLPADHKVTSGNFAGGRIDYRADRFEDSARDLGVVFDTVGGKPLKRSWSLLNPRGRMVTIAADSEGTKEGACQKSILHRRAKPERTDRDFPLARLG